MEFAMKENVLTAKDYQRLRTSVGWSVLPEQQIETALRNSLFTIAETVKLYYQKRKVWYANDYYPVVSGEA